MNTSIETYFVRRDLSFSGWADRSAEDRRLRKAEAVGSNPTRSTSTRLPRGRSPEHENRRPRPRNSEGAQPGWKSVRVPDGCRLTARSSLGGLSRNHDALHSRGGFGGVLLEIREATGPDVE